MCVFAVVHEEPIIGCGGFMFFVDHQPIMNEFMLTTTVRRLDGSEPEPLSPIICGTCGVQAVGVTTKTVPVGHLEHLGDFGTTPVGAA